jgi:hypothetical protein
LGGWISTDYRKQLALDVGGRYGIYDFENRFVRNWRVSPRYRVNDHWMLIYVYSKQEHFNDVGFSTFDPNSNAPVFGRRDVVSHTNVLTVAYSFNPVMSINCRFRHYWGYSKYYEFYSLQDSGELASSDFDGFGSNTTSWVNRNFNSFTIDCFYRWNFTPGSECIVAWKWAQIDESNEIPVNLIQDIEQISDIPQTGSVSLRLVYFLDYRLLTKNRGEAISKFM